MNAHPRFALLGLRPARPRPVDGRPGVVVKPMPLVTVVLTCPRCGADLAHVTTGRIVAGAEGSIIGRCTECRRQWQLFVRLLPVAAETKHFYDRGPGREFTDLFSGEKTAVVRHRERAALLAEVE